MKKILFLFSLLSLSALSYSQITIESGAQLIVTGGSTVIAIAGIVNNDGTINNSGTVEIRGDLENNTSAFTTSGSTGTVIFNGSAAQEITGTADAEFYGTFEIDNTTGVSITTTATGADQTINGTLVFTDGLLTLNDFNLTLTADATTPGSGKYVQTNSTGVVIRNVPGDSTAIYYPVGNSAYNPVILYNAASGTQDDYGIRVVDTVDVSGSTDHFVDRSWIVTETTPGGSALTVIPQWNEDEELPGFDRLNCDVNLVIGAGTMEWTPVGPATMVAPAIWSQDGSTFSSVGTFEVSDYFNAGKIFDLQLILAGAYNGTDMNKNLNTEGLIPLTDPYGLSTTVTAVPADAVDWVKIELRDKNDNTSVLFSFARFVDINGQVIEEDGTNFKITGAVLDDYYVATLHRNHNGIMTLNTVDFTLTSPLFDFKANTDVYGTDPQVDLGSGIYGLRKGNINSDGRISKVGPPTINDYTALLNILGTNLSLLNLYSNGDINMDGDVRKVGPPTINDYTALLNSLGTNLSILEQLP